MFFLLGKNLKHDLADAGRWIHVGIAMFYRPKLVMMMNFSFVHQCFYAQQH